ncbi:MAG TPA: hypothetical protein VGY48_06185 [Vicinamibacterales bacterium]|nr:hypothetical protein [Vicinamibacterales bacterium]
MNDTPKTDARAPIVVDLGKQRRKVIKQLRRGDGRLMDEVRNSLEQLRTAGTIPATVQPVIVIVKEKRRKRSGLFPGF